MGVNNNTVLSPINGHSKKRTPLISGRFYFLQINSGQTLIKNFPKSRQVISGHYFLYKLVYLAFFFSRISGHYKQFGSIFSGQRKGILKTFCQIFCKCYLFQTFRNFPLLLFFIFSNFLVNHWKIFS